MNLIEICIAFIVAIVSIGTPLVFDAISKFDDKYRSEEILDFFEFKSKKKVFQIILVWIVIMIGIYIIISIFAIYSRVQFLNLLIIWFSYLIFTLSCVLVGLFIHFTFTTIKFSRPTSLQKLLIEINTMSLDPKNRTTTRRRLFGKADIDSFGLITDFSINTIQRKDFPNFQKLINHFIDVYNKTFIAQRQIPEKFYETGYKITKVLATEKDRDFILFKKFTIDYLWLFDNLDDTTYDWLWQNLITIVENGEDEMIFYYWKRAFRHFEYNLRRISPTYIQGSFKHANQEEIDNRDKERVEFINFHYYLGGLLLYENRIECIRKIWDHTNSQPPRYPLLPSTMDEIFNRYFEFCKTFDQKLWEKALRFRFPRVDSVNFDWIIHSWTRKYLILLFLRQYTLPRYYVYEEFLRIPDLPETQAEKKHWLDNIQNFKNSLRDILDNTEQLKILRLDHINPEWCEKHKNLYPIEFLDTLKQKLEHDFNRAKKQQQISPEKKKAFLESSRNTINKTFKEYSSILNNLDIKDSFNSVLINGESQLFEKSDFADDQEYTNLNYDTFLPQKMKRKIQIRISESFAFVTTQKYLLDENDLFPAIDRLNIFKESSDFIIVPFKINLNYYIEVLKISHLTFGNYRKVKIQHYWPCNSDLVGNTFFILRKSDLPQLVFNEPIHDLKEEFEEREQIIPDKKIYASVIDLYKENKIREIIEQRSSQKDLEDKVFALIEMNAEIRWKKNAKVIALRVASAHENVGISNKLEEVKPFDEI
ncbi:hypothetical protein SAMN05444280_10831 [Tangfeifania diversioriginum]|uniref:Uncharacterized protein n=1 Tax=Tangfeifania diversioriginum TaxID=1168035 RepID=A0A1M6F4N9_9BACT|nr:hypothetical protein [Tangfeifania diversioriginum]SHI92623.1 hypothetical protein SAMN05444280_10831 [Tangfeifania diversioriginum]